MARKFNMKGEELPQEVEAQEVIKLDVAPEVEEQGDTVDPKVAEQINLMEYTYEKGKLVEIDGELLLVLLETLQKVWQQETKVEFELKGSFQETAKGGAKRTTTDLGVQVWALADTLAQFHINNINDGKATKVDANK